MYHITWITNVQGAQSRASEDLSGVVSGESPLRDGVGQPDHAEQLSCILLVYGLRSSFA